MAKAFQEDAFQNNTFQTSKMYRSFEGVLNASSSLNRKIAVARSGTLNLSGVAATIFRRFVALAGTLSLSGVAALLVRIAGAGAVTVDGYLTTDIFHLSTFTAEFTGIVTEIKIYSFHSCHVKVAVYSDVGGSPSALLSAVNTSTALIAGWNKITIPSVSFSLGTSYWLAFNSGV